MGQVGQNTSGSASGPAKEYPFCSRSTLGGTGFPSPQLASTGRREMPPRAGESLGWPCYLQEKEGRRMGSVDFSCRELEGSLSLALGVSSSAKPPAVLIVRAGLFSPKEQWCLPSLPGLPQRSQPHWTQLSRGPISLLQCQLCQRCGHGGLRRPQPPTGGTFRTWFSLRGGSWSEALPSMETMWWLVTPKGPLQLHKTLALGKAGLALPHQLSQAHTTDLS